MARPLKFTPALGRTICKLVRNGVPMEVAAQSEGVRKSTLYDWRERGRNGDEPFQDFAVELEKAQVYAETQCTMNIIKAAKHDWKAGAFYLKCRHPELYGDKVEITRQVQRETEETFDAMRPYMSDGAYLEMLHAYAKVTGIEELADRSARASAESPSEH